MDGRGWWATVSESQFGVFWLGHLRYFRETEEMDALVSVLLVGWD